MQVAFGWKGILYFCDIREPKGVWKLCHWTSGSPWRNGQLGQNCHLRQRLLTHWGREKMVAISQTKFSNAIAWKCVPKCPIDNIPALVQTISEPNICSGLLTPVCVTWPQCVIHWKTCTKGSHLADDFFICISIQKIFMFPLELHQSLFPNVQIEANQHWF